MRYIGSCIGRAFYLMDKAERFELDRSIGRYNVFIVNGLSSREAARENAAARRWQQPMTWCGPMVCWT